MKDKNISFGLNLKALRKKHGYTRAKLAKMIDFSEKSIEKWEYNNALPSMETVCKLSELFGITIDSLVYNQKTEIKKFNHNKMYIHNNQHIKHNINHNKINIIQLIHNQFQTHKQLMFQTHNQQHHH